MTTTTVKSIGTGGDYTTLQSWEDAAPANLVTSDIVWQGQVKNQNITGSGALLAVGGSTVDATRYKELTTEAGASFVDHANVRTNALRYNAANGASISGTASYARLISCSENYFRISKLQLKIASGAFNSQDVFYNSGSNGLIDSCIITKEVAGDTTRPGVYISTSGTVQNSLIYTTSSFAGVATLYVNGSGISVLNCVVASFSSKMALDDHYATGVIKNTIVHTAGSNAVTNGALTETSCYTTVAETGYTTTTFDTSTGTGFESITAGSEDFRIKSTSVLVDTGTSTGTPTTDISGTARSGSYDVGCWEYAAGGGATGVLTGNAVTTASIVGSSLAASVASGTAITTASAVGRSLVDAVASGDEVTTSSIVGGSAVSGVASGDIVVTSSIAGSVAGSYVSGSAVTTATIVGASLSVSTSTGNVVTSSSVAGAAISAALASGTIVVTASVVGDSVVPGAMVASGTSVVTASIVGASLVDAMASGSIVVDSSFIAVPTVSELGAGSSKRKKKQYLVDNTLRELDENEVQQLLLEAQQQLPKIKKLEAPLAEVVEEVKKTLPEKTIFKKGVVEASIKPAKKEAKQPKVKLVEAIKEDRVEAVSVVETKEDNDDEEAMQLLAVYENKREEVRKMVKGMLEGFLKNGF